MKLLLQIFTNKKEECSCLSQYISQKVAAVIDAVKARLLL